MPRRQHHSLTIISSYHHICWYQRIDNQVKGIVGRNAVVSVQSSRPGYMIRLISCNHTICPENGLQRLTNSTNLKGRFGYTFQALTDSVFRKRTDTDANLGGSVVCGVHQICVFGEEQSSIVRKPGFRLEFTTNFTGKERNGSK